MLKIVAIGITSLILAAPAAAGAPEPLRQGAQAPGPGVMRDAQGSRTGTVEQQGPNTRVIRDANGNRVETWERQGSGWVRRDKNGNRLGTVEGR